jgi:flagellar motility protein MotE (MotC chaperone)
MRRVVLILGAIILITLLTAGAVYTGFITPPKFISNIGLVKKLTPDKGKAVKVTVNQDPNLARIALLEKDISEKTKAIDRLTAENQKLNQEVTTLQATNKALKATASTPAVKPAESDAAMAAKYKQLAAYYSNMKKAKAAAILAQLDDEYVIGILQNMESETAADVVSEMDPQRAAVLTKEMLQ